MTITTQSSDELDAQVESAANKLRIAGIPIAVISFVSAWAAGPLLRFASPLAVWSLGTCLALLLAVFCICIMFRDREDDTIHFKVAMACLVGSMLAGGALLALGVSAASNSARLDRQCSLLEIDAMSLKPLRKDSLDLFEKLGCRPQGIGTLEFERRLPINSRLAQ